MQNLPPEPGSTQPLLKGECYSIVTLVDENGEDLVRAFLADPGLDKKKRARAQAMLERIASVQNYESPNFKKIGHKHPDICQARVAKDFRILMFRDGDRYVLTNFFEKDQDETPPKLLKQADRLRDFYRQKKGQSK